MLNIIPANIANKIVCVIVLWFIPSFRSMSGRDERAAVRKIKLIMYILAPKGIAITDNNNKVKPQCPFAFKFSPFMSKIEKKSDLRTYIFPSIIL